MNNLRKFLTTLIFLNPFHVDHFVTHYLWSSKGKTRLFLMGIAFALTYFSCRKDERLSRMNLRTEERNSRHIVQVWNDAINGQDCNALYKLYADKVAYYGTEIAKERCLQDKRNSFRKHPHFCQIIDAQSIEATPLGDGTIRYTFVKYFFMDGKTDTFPSYICVKQTVGGIEIEVESDDKTDDKLQYWHITGDFNGDKRKETLREVWRNGQCEKIASIEYLWKHKDEQDMTTTLVCSDKRIKPFPLDNAYLGLSILQNEGDLDGDGRDEISLTLNRETSTWHPLFLYKYQNNGWKLIYEAHVNDENRDKVYQKGDAKGEFKVLEYDEIGNETQKIIKLNK